MSRGRDGYSGLLLSGPFKEITGKSMHFELIWNIIFSLWHSTQLHVQQNRLIWSFPWKNSKTFLRNIQDPSKINFSVLSSPSFSGIFLDWFSPFRVWWRSGVEDYCCAHLRAFYLLSLIWSGNLVVGQGLTWGNFPKCPRNFCQILADLESPC